MHTPSIAAVVAASASSSSSKTAAAPSRLSSLQSGLDAYRTRAREQWKAAQFFRAMQDVQGQGHGLDGRVNERMEARSMRRKLHRWLLNVCGSVCGCAHYCRVIIGAVWKEG